MRTLADAVGVLQAHPGERLAAVRRIYKSPSPQATVLRDAFLAGADPDDVRVLLEEGDVADRGGAVLLEDRLPGRAGVDRLEDAAGSGGDQHLGEVGVQGFEVGNAADHVGRADVAPFQMADEVAVGIGRRRPGPKPARPRRPSSRTKKSEEAFWRKRHSNPPARETLNLRKVRETRRNDSPKTKRRK